MESGSCIAVTHFINPHLFWYKTIETPGEGLRVLTTIEQRLFERYKKKLPCDQLVSPQKGDKVSVNFIAWNKYIRAEILDEVEVQAKECIVWALDYGFPLLTKKEYLRYLPIALQADIGSISVGGIANVHPAEQEYDDMEGNLVIVKKDKWLQKPCTMLEKLLADASSVSFLKKYVNENGHTWGDLIIANHKGVNINARDYLLRTTDAVEEEDLFFKANCSTFKTTKIAPWLSNDRNTNLKYNNIKNNYVEHSNQMNTDLVDENAKRKVEDWQKRNERKSVEAASDVFEPNRELYDNNIDDLTFDDSVSVACQQQVNYIGKAGVLTKIKQKKYPTIKNVPPPAPAKFFEIDDMMFKLNCSKKPQNAPSSVSESTGVSSEEKLCHNFTNVDATNNLWNDNFSSGPKNNLIDLESNSSISKTLSVKERQKNLLEMRKKIARDENGLKIRKSSPSKEMFNQSKANNSTSCQSKTQDNNPYYLQQQLPTLSTTMAENEQANQSELTVKNVRIKQLLAMRKKFGSSTISSSTNCSQINNKTESQVSMNASELKKEKLMHAEDKNSINCRLEPKMENKTPQMHSFNASSKKKIKESLELSKCGYDGLTMVPAGFDITRLTTYRNENTHWHRKKSVRNDYVPHENSTYTEEVLSNNTKDHSCTSSDISLNKSFPTISQSSKNNQLGKKTSTVAEVEPESQLKISSKQQVSELNNLTQSNLYREPSASSNSSALHHIQRKRRQLKSPTSQLQKIDQILNAHGIEKNMGNNNILDLQLLNTGSILACTSSNFQKKQSETLANNTIIRNSSSHSSCSADNIRNEKVFNVLKNYETIMDVKHSETLPLVEGERKIQTKYIDHLVLAHTSIQLTPIENISEAPFLPEIHNELRQMRVNKVYRIQVYSWSHISRNNSLFVVNPSKSGKTWSYLPSLCSLICCRKDSFKLSYGPVAIILVASLKHVELVNGYCRRLMSGFKNEVPTCVPSYGLRNLIETKLHLLNGCGILVATPSNVLRLLRENENEPLFDADRLQHIVIDDMDIMMSRSQEDFEQAYKILFKMAKKNKFNKLFPQLIVTSRDWDGLMLKFIKKSSQPLLLIGDFIEAAVYGHATLSVKFKSNNAKNGTVLNFLNEISKSGQDLNNRTLIICTDDNDVQNVQKFLQERGYCCLSFFSRSTEIDRVTIDEWKRKVSSQILISTDACLCELKVQNVNNLIHYSMPTSWSQFTFRFSALVRTYNNSIRQFELNTLSSGGIANTRNNAYAMILLDETNNLQLPRLVEFMHKHNQQVNDEIQNVSKRLLIRFEEQRIFKALCPQLLEFGECDESRCDYRHELTQFDAIKKSDDIPCNGEIRLHVLKVFSPTYYAVRLLRYRPPNTVKWNEVRRSDEALTFSIQLNRHYSDGENLSLHWPPHINDICIYQYRENYRRARILEAPTIQENEINIVQSTLKVTLKLIDEGSVISSVKCNEIFLCDEKFKVFPPQAIDVRLARVVPFDNERSWDAKTTKQVKKWIIEDIESNYVVQANIDFAFANTIWVKNIAVMEKLTGIDAYCQIVNLRKSLVEKKFGILYNGSRKQVRDIVEQFDLLNSSQFHVDSVNSDLDYQSCKNESADLIRFSSSNDESPNFSMESAKTDLDKIPDKDKAIDLEEKCKGTNCVDNENMPTEVEENWDSLERVVEVYDPFQISSDEKIETTREESWIKLSLNELIKVEIGDEGENGNWANIFLQIIDANSMFLFDELNKLILKHIEKLKASKENQRKACDFKPSLNCLVKYNNLYLRAKIYAIYGETEQQRLYKFFLCDYACFINAKADQLDKDFFYETTDEIITFTPYQAVHCTLAGIKFDPFTKRYQVTKEYLYACAIVENGADGKANSNLENLPINSYKILLYECDNEKEFNNASLFNKTLLDKGITLCDEETKSILEYEICIPESEKQNPNIIANNEKEIDLSTSCNEDKVLSYQQLLEFIKLNAYDTDMHELLTEGEKTEVDNINGNISEIKDKSNYSQSVKNTSDATLDEKKKVHAKSEVPTLDSEAEEQGHCTSISNSSIKSSASLISADVSNCSALESVRSPLPFLKALYKRPTTTWYQNDCMIFLSIHAPDINNYLLELTSKTLIFMATIQCEKSILILNFLASVDSKSVSHEIKGLNVIIRLKKNYFINWPRLLRQPTKYSWLKYNFNKFDSNEMEYIAPQRVLYNMLDTETNYAKQEKFNYNSDEDSEKELYQTYNVIQDNDDDGDPFSIL